MLLWRKSGPPPFLRQGERSEGPYAEKSKTLPAKGVGAGGQGSICCRMGKLESPRGRGNPPLNGLWLRG